MEYNYPKFTPEMKKTHTILIPNMAIKSTLGRGTVVTLGLPLYHKA